MIKKLFKIERKIANQLCKKFDADSIKKLSRFFLTNTSNKAFGNIYSCRRIYNDFFEFFIPLHNDNETTVIIYQMGKVGSTSINHSLKSYGYKSVFHTHYLNPNNMKKKIEVLNSKKEYKNDKPIRKYYWK